MLLSKVILLTVLLGLFDFLMVFILKFLKGLFLRVLTGFLEGLLQRGCSDVLSVFPNISDVSGGVLKLFPECFLFFLRRNLFVQRLWLILTP